MVIFLTVQEPVAGRSSCRRRSSCRMQSSEEATDVNATTDVSEDALICFIENSTESWILDSGTSLHDTYSTKMMKNIRTGNFGKVRLADHRTLDITGLGDIDIKTSMGTTWTLRDVRVIPSLKKMLIYAGQLDDQRYRIILGDGQWKVVKQNIVIAKGKKKGTLYMVEVPDDEVNAVTRLKNGGFRVL